MPLEDRSLGKAAWVRPLVEVVVIASGVAFGLAGDAWWGTRQDRVRQSEYLANLHQDFETNQRDLAKSISYTDSVLKSARHLMDVMSNRQFDTPRDSLVDHIALLFMSAPHAAVTTTYDELVASGDLKLIRDPELRRALAHWAVQVEQQEMVKGWFFDQWETLHTPFVFEETVFTDIDPDYMGFEYPPAPHQMDFAALLQSKKFWNLVALRVVTAMDLKNFEEGKLAPATERVIQHLPVED